MPAQASWLLGLWTRAGDTACDVTTWIGNRAGDRLTFDYVTLSVSLGPVAVTAAVDSNLGMYWGVAGDVANTPDLVGKPRFFKILKTALKEAWRNKTLLKKFVGVSLQGSKVFDKRTGQRGTPEEVSDFVSGLGQQVSGCYCVCLGRSGSFRTENLYSNDYGVGTLSRLPTTPQVALLHRRKPKPFPLPHTTPP